MSKALDSVKSLFKKSSDASTSHEAIKLSIPTLKNSNLYYWLALIPLFALALFIRIQNLPLLKGKYLIELDSYFFFRYAKMLLETGTLPVVDAMRYVPIGTKALANGAYWFFPKTLVFFYKLVQPIFPNLSQIEWHVIYPPVITIISFIFFFLFVKELLNYRIAFIATAFLAVIPAYLQRTGAGFADHEAVAMLWMFISLWLFVVAWKSEDWKKYLPLAAISGLFASMMGATWGGYTFLVYGLALFICAYTFLYGSTRKNLFTFGVWTAIYAIGSFAFVVRDRILGLSGMLLGFALLFLLLHVVLHRFIKTKKVPYGFFPLCAAALISIPLALAAGINIISILQRVITSENAGRIFYTVSENAQPYFLGGWWDSFGLIFLLAFIGSAIFFYKIFKSEDGSKLKLHWLAAIAYIIFFLAFIFGRFSQSGKHQALVNFFSSTYLYWLAGFMALIGIIYLLAYYKDTKALEGLKNKWPWVLLAVWFLLTLIAARGQIRLLFATVPPIAIASAVFVSEIIDQAKSWSKNVKYVAIIGIILLALFAFGTAAQQTEMQNKYSGSMTPGQWGNAMTWIRTNTTEDAVFAHWWDYGYMTIALGNRSAVTDGGNEKGWNHQSGRYALTGKDDNSTLTYLKTHDVTHLLISSEEIMKYHAFSLIGSDENLDRSSTIGIFAMQQQKEVRNGTQFVYTGGWQLDKDYVLGKLILSEQNAGIGGFSFTIQNDSITAPIAYVISNGQQLELPINCIKVQGKTLTFDKTNDSLTGCLMLAPYFDQNGQGNPFGGAFWLSEKTYDTNFAKLYMYNETSPYFKQVYSDDTPLGIYGGRIIGPIKIWEVQYPDNITADPFYLQSSEYG